MDANMKESLKRYIADTKLNEIHGSSMCQFSVIENKLRDVYKNQQMILEGIKLLMFKELSDENFN